MSPLLTDLAAWSCRCPPPAASHCPSAVTSRCSTTSLVSTSRPPSTSRASRSKACPCRPGPPSSAPRPSPSSRRSSSAPPPSRVRDARCGSHRFQTCSSHQFISPPAGLQTSNKASGFPLRMENSLPLVPPNQSSQSLHIQPGMLAQVAGPTANNFLCASEDIAAALDAHKQMRLFIVNKKTKFLTWRFFLLKLVLSSD